ncbi:putative lipoprotein [Synechococcus sp. JA-3-3Ab]|nr:putative lipoprotein [Synechococcus sp. JA-3-3Ab]
MAALVPKKWGAGDLNSTDYPEEPAISSSFGTIGCRQQLCVLSGSHLSCCLFF